MTTIIAKSKGINAGQDCTKELIELFDELKNVDGAKELVFEKGIYNISSKLSSTEKFFITNTVGDKEWRNNEVPHQYSVGININNINNLAIKGNGAVFLVDGKMTNMVISECENITVQDCVIDVVNPNLHEIKVTGKGLFYVDYELDCESKYVKNGTKFSFVGTDYIFDFAEMALNGSYFARFGVKDSDNVRRVPHPLLGALKIEEVSPYNFRVYYIIKPNCDIGDVFSLFDNRRDNVGIFVSQCKNVVFENVEQNFNYSLSLVAQDTENITVNKCIFAPKKNSAKKLVALADFIQICMCKGDVNITDCIFDGAADDCINVHGMYYQIISTNGNKLTVKHMHPQSHGFNAFHAGDHIEFISHSDLLTKGAAIILDSVTIDEYNIELTVDNATDAIIGLFVEDIDMCPNLTFKNNYMTHIITRGILVTTRGKVLIEGNNFNNTTMSTIFISNDAQGWYESGRVIDTIIQNNRFGVTYGNDILIKPENSVCNGAVHSNIIIANNEFIASPKGGINIKSTENIEFIGNKIPVQIDKFIKLKNVANIILTNE